MDELVTIALSVGKFAGGMISSFIWESMGNEVSRRYKEMSERTKAELEKSKLMLIDSAMQSRASQERQAERQVIFNKDRIRESFEYNLRNINRQYVAVKENLKSEVDKFKSQVNLMETKGVEVNSQKRDLLNKLRAEEIENIQDISIKQDNELTDNIKRKQGEEYQNIMDLSRVQERISHNYLSALSDIERQHNANIWNLEDLGSTVNTYKDQVRQQRLQTVLTAATDAFSVYMKLQDKQEKQTQETSTLTHLNPVLNLDGKIVEKNNYDIVLPQIQDDYMKSVSRRFKWKY